ncbi:hypothetical protein CFOL_v3_00766 [Cephalotus follicularis]|uniref:Zf-RVT domain-containing protein n=1 Tax=Cephalotus follicularis TaxID=3775 RepID=A0A1Q3ANB8_CEPFO|nr:hypothetical protein CFOL_v3_00766 [Cephalotus follicularis]
MDKCARKVRWNLVCKPRKQGGLGLRSLQTWNIASIFKHLWALLQNQKSQWVQWVNSEVFRGNILWLAHHRGTFSWSLRKLLILREKLRSYLVYYIGDGSKFSLWTDPWLYNLSIIKAYGHKVKYEIGLGR